MPVAHHVPQLCVVAGAKHGRELVGPSRRLADGRERLVALRSVEFLFHLRKRCPDDVVMMDVRADGLGRIQPDAMDEVEIGGRERRRMGADVVRIGASAAMMDDQPDVVLDFLRRLLPGDAKKARLLVGRERRRLADVHVGRSQAQDCRDDCRENVVRGDDEQADRPVEPLGERRHG